MIAFDVVDVESLRYKITKEDTCNVDTQYKSQMYPTVPRVHSTKYSVQSTMIDAARKMEIHKKMLLYLSNSSRDKHEY